MLARERDREKCRALGEKPGEVRGFLAKTASPGDERNLGARQRTSISHASQKEASE